MSLFQDKENTLSRVYTGNFAVKQGKVWRHGENNLTVIINIRSRLYAS